MTLYLQDTLRWSPIALAMALLPAGLLVAFSAPFADRIIARFGTGRLIAAALIGMSIGYLLFLRVDEHPAYLTLILPTVLLLGFWVRGRLPRR